MLRLFLRAQTMAKTAPPSKTAPRAPNAMKDNQPAVQKPDVGSDLLERKKLVLQV